MARPLFLPGTSQPSWTPSPELGFFEHNLEFEEPMADNIWIAYQAFEEENRLVVRVAAPTEGWIGFGPSETGSMIGANPCVVYEVDGVMQAFAMHSEDFVTPTLNRDQNCRLLDYRLIRGESYIEIERPLLGCRPEDRDIEKGHEKRFVAAFGAEMSSFVYHGMEERNTLFIDVFSGPPPDYRDELPPEAKELDAFVLDDTIPPERDVYLCRGMELPADQRYQAVGYEPILADISPAYYHHVILFACPWGLPPRWQDGENHKCPGAGGDVGCLAFWIGWATGQHALWDFDHPWPFGAGENAPKYILVETHIDNPNRETIPMDAWGLKIHYVPAFSSVESGILAMYLMFPPVRGIPPGESSSYIVGECGSRCTQLNIPEDGMHVYALTPHMHYYGIQSWVQVLRQNRLGIWEEVGNLGKLDYWDADWQGPHFRRGDEILVLPGDRLIGYCVYNTEDRTEPIYFGEGFEDEMCTPFILHYPLIGMDVCFVPGIPNSETFGVSLCTGEPYVAPYWNRSYVPLPEDPNHCEVR